MSLVHWTEADQIGVSAIDDQHEALATCLNSFHELVVDGAESDLVDRALTELLDLLQEHFSTEAQLMAKRDYPKIETHLAEHRIYIERIQELQRNHASSNSSAVAETFFLLRDWFVAHTHKEDRLLGEYLTRQA